MPRTTDDIANEFIEDVGLSADVALDLAYDYIAEGSFQGTTEWLLEGLNDLTDFDTAEANNYQDIESKIEEDIPDIFHIGCEFKGIKQIVEYEDDLIYIPSSYYCGIKCYEKYFQTAISTIGLNPFEMTLDKIKATVVKSIKPKTWSDAPRFFRWGKVANKSQKKFIRINSHHSSTANARVLLISFGKSNYHAVLLKMGEKYEQLRSEQSKHLGFSRKNQKSKKNQLSVDDSLDEIIYKYIKDKIKFEKLLTLKNDWIRLRSIKYVDYINNVFAYDIETYVAYSNITRKDAKTGLNKQIEKKNLIPIALAYKKVSIEDEKEDEKNEVYLFKGEDCFDQFIESLVVNYPEEDTYYVFAHCGGSFDNIFSKNVKALKFTNQIKTGGGIRRMSAQIIGKDKQIVFLDSYSFTQLSLKVCCETFKTKHKKIDFDIVDKPREWYFENTDWIKYLEYDVRSLSDVIRAFDNSIRVFGECMANNVGIASIAWRTMYKSCFHLKNQYIAKDPCTARFIRESVYGGRMIHWIEYFGLKNKNEAKESLICLDGNSLYPSAMFVGYFPVGKPEIITQPSVSLITEYLDKNILFIAEVTLDGQNIRYPLIPFKTESGMLLYKSNKFTGVYTSVEIYDALKMGYKLVDCKRGIMWKKGAKIFEDLILNMYSIRQKLKEENNPSEYTYKIMLNAMYGKFLEMIKTYIKFNVDENIKADKACVSNIALKNGQYEQTYRLLHPIDKKPVHIGSFILSYARSLMNKLILQIGSENVLYGDTDSIYIYKSALKNSTLKFSNNLCGFKNDYGEGLEILEAYFLDIKRYFLEFNNDKFKIKFNGINFKTKNALQNWDDGTLNQKEVYRNLYKWFRENPNTLMEEQKGIWQDKWKRNCSNVDIEVKALRFQINPNKRCIWKEENGVKKSFALDFEFEKPFRIIEKQIADLMFCEVTKSVKSNQYILTNTGLTSSVPLSYPKSITLPKNKLPKKFVDTFTSSFVLRNGLLLKIEPTFKVVEVDKNKEEEKKTEDVNKQAKRIIVNRQHKCCEYGSICEFNKNEPDNQDFDFYVIAVPKTEKSISQSTNTEKMNFLTKCINNYVQEAKKT